MNIHQRIAVEDQARLFVRAGGAIAVADDAADILAAREAAFGNACACGTVQKPGNPARIVTVLQRNTVVGDRTGDITDIRPTGNAAGAFFFCRHRTVVQALGHHNAISVLSACEKVGVCQIVLGIKPVLDRHAADDAADIVVAPDLTPVGAAARLAQGQLALGLRNRDVLEHRVVPGGGNELSRLNGRTGQRADVVTDAVQIV